MELSLPRWIMVLAVGVACAGCGADRPGAAPFDAPADASTGPLVDAGFDVPLDAGITVPLDASVDAPPVDLSEICGREPGTPDDWETCYHERWCEWRVGCSPMNGYLDVPECVARSGDVEGDLFATQPRERLRAVGQGRATIDLAAFTQCLLDTSRERCNTARYSVACANRYVGTIPDGGDCYTDIECRSPDATCASGCTAACCPGICQPKLKLGDPCDLDGTCEPGLVCDQICRSGDVGSSCTNVFDCDSSAWCDAGVCAADLAPGAVCINRSQCGGETTCTGLSTIVDPHPGQCLAISRPGDACDFICFGNLYCAASGTCQELPTLGRSCSAFIPCRGVDAICSDGVCVALEDEGEGCRSTGACRPGLFCTSEVSEPTPVCARLRGAEQACTQPSQCESHACSSRAGELGRCLPWSEVCPTSGL